MSESVKAAALEAASFKEAGFRAVKIKVTDDFENDDDDSGDDDDDDEDDDGISGWVAHSGRRLRTCRCCERSSRAQGSDWNDDIDDMTMVMVMLIDMIKAMPRKLDEFIMFQKIQSYPICPILSFVFYLIQSILIFSNLPKVGLMVDSNHAHSVPTAIRLAK